MSLNTFRPRKVADFTIVTDDKYNEVVGHIRVKPSGVLWAPKDSKVWYGLSLEQFGDYAMKKGKKQRK